MPIYDYRCTACDHLAEVIHGINDPGPRFCESCGAEGTIRKGVGMPAVLYRGSGWARKEGPSRRASAGGGPDGSTDGSGKVKPDEGGSKNPSSESKDSSAAPAAGAADA